MRLLVSYTYLTEGGNRQYACDIIDPQTNKLTLAEAAFIYVRTQVSSEAVILGVWLMDMDAVNAAMGVP